VNNQSKRLTNKITKHTFKIVSSLALPNRFRDGFGDSAPLPVDVFSDCDVELLPSLCGNVFDFSHKRERSLLSLLLLLLLESGWNIDTSKETAIRNRGFCEGSILEKHLVKTGTRNLFDHQRLYQRDSSFAFCASK
jgi:hypothetical protein